MRSVTLTKIRGEFAKTGLRGVIRASLERPWRWVGAFRELGRQRRFQSSQALLDYTRTLSAGWFSPQQIDSEICALLDRVRELGPRIVVEIGTASGGTLFMFTRVAAPDAILISIDLPDGEFGGGYARWRSPLYRRFALTGQTIHLLRGNSHAAHIRADLERLLAGTPVDFLFIDGDHSYDGVRRDHDDYSRLVRAGGIIAFHDVAPHYEPQYGVARFWSELAEANPACVSLIEAPGHGYGIGYYGRG